MKTETLDYEDNELFTLKTFRLYIMYFCFLITPKKVLRTYVVLSMLAFIYSVNKREFVCEHIQTKQIKKLLNISMNDDVLILPKHTFHWFWSREILDETIDSVHRVSLKVALNDSTTTLKYIGGISDKFIEKLPSVFRLKLNIKNKENFLNLKHDLARSIMYNT